MVPVWRPDAPFRSYAHTDETIYADGFKSGSNWAPHWNHLPGGPWMPDIGENAHPDWREYCLLLKRHNKIWLAGWRAGVKTIRPVRRDIKKLLSIAVIEKLSG